MAEDEDITIIKIAEGEKREMGIAEQNPHNRKKERWNIKGSHHLQTEHQMKNVN